MKICWINRFNLSGKSKNKPECLQLAILNTYPFRTYLTYSFRTSVRVRFLKVMGMSDFSAVELSLESSCSIALMKRFCSKIYQATHLLQTVNTVIFFALNHYAFIEKEHCTLRRNYFDTFNF